MSKSERVAGQESLHTEGGSAGCLCSATIVVRRWWVFNVTPRPLYPMQVTKYPLNGRLGGPQRRSGSFCSRETSLAPTGIPASNRPPRSTAQYLYRPHYVGCKNVQLLRLNRTASNANKNICFYSQIRTICTTEEQKLAWKLHFIWESPSSGILRSVHWQFVSDVSGQHIGPIFKVRRWGR